jgi:DNA mismatch repair protein MutS2
LQKDPYALIALEFDRVRELLARFCTSPLARAAIGRLSPFVDPQQNRRALTQVTEMVAWLEGGGRLPLAPLSDSRTWLDTFVHGTHRPTGPELADLSRALRMSGRLQRTLSGLADLPELSALAERLPEVGDLHECVETTIDDKGDVLSSASVVLGRVRGDVKKAQNDIHVQLDRLLRTSSVQKALQSPQVVWRNDRPVLQVKPEARRQIGGIVHDRSQTGQTVFVEPASVVELANRLGELRAEERMEVQRVIAELLRVLRERADDLKRTLDGLAWIDFTNARARLVRELGFTVPAVAPTGAFRLVGARHPLLLIDLWLGNQSRAEAEASVMPLDIDLGEPYAMLVVTGPNTGGKTVALKTVGLLAVMAQAGIPVPASEAALPFVDGVFADIGDEQAIEQSLSTFSSHMTRVGRALDHATAQSLVLLDELGAGTDPEEGGALGYAILEALLAREVPTVATTHLSRLKDFAYENARAEVGSMAFDPDALQPLFRLEVGIPGDSQALHVAGAVGIAAQVIDRARAIIGDRDSRLEEMIAGVQRARRAAEEQRREAAESRRRAASDVVALEKKAEEVDRRETWMQEEAEHFVDEELRAARELLIEPLKHFLNAPRPYDEKARGMLSLLEALLSGSSLGRRRDKYIEAVKKGHMVYVPRFQRRCKVLRVDRKRRMLKAEVGSLEMEVSFDDVSWLQPLG